VEDPEVLWRPHAGAQTVFFRRNEFEVLFGGAAGPGKTDCLIIKPLESIHHPKFRGLILRRTFPRLQEIIDRCWSIYGAYDGVYRTSEHRWYFPSGATIQLGHCQHEESKRDYHGKEFQYIGVDELTEFTESQYLFLMSRARSVHPEIRPKMRAATNPGGIGHAWVKERFVDVAAPLRAYRDPKTGLTRAFVPGTLEDNPTLFLNDPDYLNRLENLPEIEKKRLRYGIWDAFEGQVFTELSQRVHGYEDADLPPEWERICVLDWGYAKPFCVLWGAVDYDGCIWVYREWYGCKRETEGLHEGADQGLKLQAWEVAKGILDREKGEKIRMRIADPAIWHPRPENRKREALGVTIQEDMANQGVYFLKADNDRMHGKAQVHKRLKLSQTVDTETGEIEDVPQVRIANSCMGFWRTMPHLREDPKNLEDVDTDQEDHVYDTFRYLCMARPVRPKRTETQAPGSFRAERNRLLRAKEYARRHGVSVEAAYRRRTR
jgi:hypothetical protein